MNVPTKSGIGVEVTMKMLQKLTLRSEVFKI
jgi:hypothetical protein